MYAVCTLQHGKAGDAWSSTNSTDSAVVNKLALAHDNEFHDGLRTASILPVDVVPGDDNDNAAQRFAYEASVSAVLTTLEGLIGSSKFQKPAEAQAIQAGIDSIRIAHFGS